MTVPDMMKEHGGMFTDQHHEFARKLSLFAKRAQEYADAAQLLNQDLLVEVRMTPTFAWTADDGRVEAAVVIMGRVPGTDEYVVPLGATLKIGTNNGIADAMKLLDEGFVEQEKQIAELPPTGVRAYVEAQSGLSPN